MSKSMPTIAVSYSPLVKKPIHEFKVGQFYKCNFEGTGELYMIVSIYTTEESTFSRPDKFCTVNINSGVASLPVSDIKNVFHRWHESHLELVKDPFTVTVTP